MKSIEFVEFSNGLELELFDRKNGNSVHKILHTGSFDQGGHKFEIRAEHLIQMQKNFEKKVLGTDPPVDFAHKDEDRAAGWIRDLFLEDENNSLYAEIQWTKSGQESLSNKEFRYFSASFTFDFFDGSTGNSHGPVLRGGGLTNVPFLRHNPPLVELSKGTEAKADDKKPKEKETKKMSTEETITLEDHRAEVKELQDKLDKASQELVELTSKVEELDSLKAKNIELVQQIAKEKKEAAFKKLLSEGKACEAQREAFMANDMEKFIELAKPMNLSEKGNSGSDGKEKHEFASKDEEEMYNTFLADHITKEEYFKSQKV